MLLAAPHLVAVAALAGAEARLSGFTDVAPELGLVFVHDAAVGGEYFIPESIGAGGALFDYDRDGDLDVYLIHGAQRRATAGEALRNRLFRREADGTFRDVTASSGLGDPGYGMGVAIGDVDVDGDPEVYVTNHGADAFYRNLGDGTFRESSGEAGLRNPDWGCSAVFFDLEPDGDLDLYVTNYLDFDPAAVCTDAAGRRDYCGPAGFAGVPDRLFRNDGAGRFTDVSRAAGIAGARNKGLGVVSADFDRDGRQDLYVADDGEPNLLWMNRGTGPEGAVAFTDRAAEMGAAVNAFGQAEAGMGIALGDADGDGDQDLFVTHLRAESNTFYRHAGALGFVDDSAAAGLAGDLPYTGFGTAFLDADNDGDLDLVVVNGRVTRGPPATEGSSPPSYWDPYAEPDFLYENDGSGRFGAAVRLGAPGNGRGLAVGDVDGDGDPDLLVTQGGGPVKLLRNDVAGDPSWLLVRALEHGRDALGATVTATAGDRRLARWVAPGSSFLSSHDPRAHFGLGHAPRVAEVRVRWLDGKVLAIRDLPVRRRLVVMRR